jgi:hypothetical protein
MKNIIITALVSIATLMAGLYIGASYIGKGEVFVTLCVMGEVAVKENYLSEQQLLSLLESTGKKIKMDYSVLADNISLSDEFVSRASGNSNCSQMLVGLTKGMK